MRYLFILVSLVSIGAGPVAAQSVISRVSPEDAQVASEVSIAINPANLNNIVAGSLVRGVPGSDAPNMSFYSFDGGKSWNHVAVPNPDKRTQGDDVILFHRDGTALHGFITFVGLWEENPERAANGIALVRSKDGGVTWTEEQSIVADHLNTKSPMEDKPWFAFDRSRRSPHFGNLYCAWTRFDVYGSDKEQDTTQIMFSRSRDGGESFGPVIRISDQPGDCVDDDNTVEGAVPCTLPDGTIVVVWAGPRGLEMDRSKDGGVTFGEDRVMGELHGGWSSDIEGITRHNGMPVTGVDHSFGPHRGSLYVNFIDERNGHKDVFLMISRDGGETWLETRRVNDDPAENARDQFFTWMSVDPVDGSINIAFYDRRDTEGTQTRLTLARSVDGGETFRNIPIDFPEFDCSNPRMFFGDYLGIDALRGRVAVGFMHFESPQKIAVSSAVMDFEPGTCNPLTSAPGEGELESVEVQHLLVAFKGTIPEKKEITRSKEEAQTLAASLLERAKSGEDFDKLVKEFTDDQHPGIYRMSNFWSKPDMSPEVTADKLFPRSMMVKSFGDVSFSLEVGEIGVAEYDPDHSKYGWHIIKRIR
jgi:PPIC-type PPIASE domain/BNR/Asp-box repeat